MPTGGRFLMARNRIVTALQGLFRLAGLRRGRDGGAPDLARERGASARLRHRGASARTERGSRSSSTPRRNSPARSCSPQAKSGSPASPGSSATGSAAPCTTRNSPCSNGTGPAEPYEALMRDCANLIGLAAETAGTRTLAFRGMKVNPFQEPERLTVAEAFRRIRRHRPPLDPRAPKAGRTGTGLPARSEAAGLRTAADDTWSDLFSRVIVERVEPVSGRPPRHDPRRVPGGRGGARPPDRPRPAGRGTLRALCLRGRARERLRRTDRSGRAAPAVRGRDGARRCGSTARAIPLDEDFLAALALMPEASGIALGLDRLVMLATGASRIEQVLWAPVPDATYSRSEMEARNDGDRQIPPRRGGPRQGRARRAGAIGRPRRGRPALRRRRHARRGGADRAARPARPDRPPVRALPCRTRHDAARSARIRSATRRTAPSRASCTAIRTGCCSRRCTSARSIAASASGARWSARRAWARSRPRRSTGALAYIARPCRDLGGDPHRRRSAGALPAPPARHHGRLSRQSATCRSCASIPACRWSSRSASIAISSRR